MGIAVARFYSLQSNEGSLMIARRIPIFAVAHQRDCDRPLIRQRDDLGFHVCESREWDLEAEVSPDEDRQRAIASGGRPSCAVSVPGERGDTASR